MVPRRILSVALLSAAAATSMGCTSTRPSSPQSAATKTAKLALRIAIVPDIDGARQAGASTPTSSTLSCHGGAFCRENVITVVDASETIQDATEDCARRKGSLSTEPCTRQSVAAACSVDGEAGPITVFTYAIADAHEQSEHVAQMSEACEKLDGTLLSVNLQRARQD